MVSALDITNGFEPPITFNPTLSRPQTSDGYSVGVSGKSFWVTLIVTWCCKD